MEVHRSKHMKKLNHPTTTTMTHDSGIPDWLLFELLLRLPLNRVVACRLVSKQWLSIASDPYFIRAYASRAESTSQKPYWTVLSPYVRSERSKSSPTNCIMPLETYLRPRLCNICLPCQPRDADQYTAVGVSDGLVLYYRSRTLSLSNFDLSNFYLCNPITGHWIRACTYAGPPLSHLRARGWGFVTRLDGEFVLKSYRIVKAEEGIDRFHDVIFEVYYSETDEWKKFTVALPDGLRLNRLPLIMQKSGAVLDGILHWAENELGVIVYDPEANPNQVRVIPGPRNVDHDGLMLSLCLEHRGELRYIGGYLGPSCDFPSFSVWRRLEDYGGTGEWCYQHKIESKDIIGSGIFDHMELLLTLESLFFDPCDSDVVYFVGLDGFSLPFVFSCNLKSGRLDERPEMIVEDGPFLGYKKVHSGVLCLSRRSWGNLKFDRSLTLWCNNTGARNLSNSGLRSNKMALAI